MPILELSYLECKGCPERIYLPNQTPQVTAEGLPSWPTGYSVLRLLCPFCGNQFSYSRNEIHQEPDKEAPREPSNILWRATLACGHKNCGRKVFVHTIAANRKTAGILFSGLLVECSEGHPSESSL